MSDKDQTHYADCWQQPYHRMCAVMKVQELQAQLETAERAIRDAPHDITCPWHHSIIANSPKLYEITDCNCWKAAARAQMEVESDE